MLKVKCHDWSQSDFSADFKCVTTAVEFFSKWMNKQGLLLHSSTNKVLRSRKCTTSASPMLRNDASPPNLLAFFKEEIDESTERKEKVLATNVMRLLLCAS